MHFKCEGFFFTLGRALGSSKLLLKTCFLAQINSFQSGGGEYIVLEIYWPMRLKPSVGPNTCRTSKSMSL